MRSIFRKTALKKLSTPEKLEQLPRVVTPLGWVSLLAITLLIILSLTWGWFGRIPRRVTGSGMLLMSSGITDVVPLASGRLSQLSVEEGDIVTSGQVVAYLDQPELWDEIRIAQTTLIELKRKYSQFKEFEKSERELKHNYIGQQKYDLEASALELKQKMELLQKELEKGGNEFLKDNKVAAQTMAEMLKVYSKILQDTRQTISEMHELEIEKIEYDYEKKMEELDLKGSVSDAEQRLRLLQESFERKSKIVNMYPGKVIEITATVGEVVHEGDPILRIERLAEWSSGDLEAYIYIPSIDGKKVKRGMRALVEPSTVNAGLYGHAEGMVTYVSEYPSTELGMMNILDNQQLVKALSKEGAPIEIRIDLISDPNTISGYKWTSKKGPNVGLHSGTYCSATVWLDEVPPISFVIPWLKKIILGEKRPD
jgi:HlyD family secretion protein